MTIILFLLSGLYYATYGQSYTLTIHIKNQPQTQIFLGTIKGDKFSPIDSTMAKQGVIRFDLPQNSLTGIYRLVFGQTTYARVMNEPPQQLDFIVNKEDIVFETDFKAPFDSFHVINSEENRVWFEFLRKEKKLKDEIKITEMELEYFRSSAKQLEAAKRVEKFNALQKQRDSLIRQQIKKHPALYASKLIKMYREPLLDGKQTKAERTKKFQQEYFSLLDFSDISLIYSPVYTTRVFGYLMSFAQRGLSREQQEQEFMRATDIILTSVRKSEGFAQSEALTIDPVYEFILDYLVRGFEKLHLENLITYIAENYSGTTCQTDEVSTLERKLEARKMKIGTKVPDFTLHDINGDPVTLSEILKSRNLILFWASWCPHCLEMLPKIKQWMEQIQFAKFEVIAISLDTSKPEWSNAVFDLGIESWYNLSDFKGWEGQTTIDYNVYATPTMFVIDKDMTIISKPLTFNDLSNTIN